MALWYKGTIELLYNGVTVKSFLHYFKWIQAVNDLPTPGQYGTVITNDFTYITSRCNEPAIVGDTILNPFVGDWNVLTNLSNYISQYDEIPFANTGHYTIKFILPNGRYAIENIGLASSVEPTSFYNSDGSLIGTVGAGIIYGNANYTDSQGNNNGGVSMWFYKSYNGDTKEITPNKYVMIDYRPRSGAVYYNSHSFSTSEIQTINTFFGASTPSPSPTSDNPYSPGGTSGPDGGDGNYTIQSDPIDFPALPSISVADAGFVSIWVPTLPQLQDLANFMWNADPTKIDFWKKLIANPMELILGLHLLPFQVETETLPASVTMGFIDTGIEMFYTDQQFHEIDCGTLELEEFWGAFLDYAPYTQLDIYLPFIGVRSLNVNDCMPKQLALKYIIDIVTGACVAILKCDDSVFYHFSGNCASEVPVTASQMQEIVKSAFSLVTSIATGAATGGVAGAITAGAVGAASAIANTGQHADRSGAIGGTTGFMSVQTPYLILTRPRQAMPEDQQTYTGYPSFITKTMDDLIGYTEIEVTHLHGMSCTSAECDEIIRLLGEGVIF